MSSCWFLFFIHCWWDLIRTKQLSSISVCRAQVFAGFSGHGNSICRVLVILKYYLPTIRVQIIYSRITYKQDLVLKILLGLICNKTQSANQLTKYVLTIALLQMHMIYCVIFLTNYNPYRLARETRVQSQVEAYQRNGTWCRLA